MPAKPKPNAWVISHYEVIGEVAEPSIDCVLFHVSSTRKRAEAYIKKVGVNSWSYWQLEPFVMDDADLENEGDEVYFYSHDGKPLKEPPIKKIAAVYKKTGWKQMQAMHADHEHGPDCGCEE